MMSNFCWPHRAQCIKDCLILYIRKLNLFKHIVQDWKTTTSAVHLHLRNQCQTVYRGRTEKTDGLHGIKEVIYVKLYPCTAGGGWGSMTSLMSYLQCRPDISTSIVSLQFKLKKRLWFTARGRWFPQWSKFIPSLKQFPQQSGVALRGSAWY